MKQIIGALIVALIVGGIIFGTWASVQALKSVKHPTVTPPPVQTTTAATAMFLPAPDAQPTAQPTMDYDPALGALRYCDTMRAYCTEYPGGKECADAKNDCTEVW